MDPRFRGDDDQVPREGVNGYLLDTHALLWWLYGDLKLSVNAQDAIKDEQNAIFVSSASAWEISTKYRIGKLPHAKEAAENLKHHLKVQKFTELPVTIIHAQRAGLLHKRS